MINILSYSKALQNGYLNKKRKISVNLQSAPVEASAIRCRLSGALFAHGNTPVKPAVSTGNFPEKSLAGGHVLVCALCRAGRFFTHDELKIRHSQKINHHVFIY